MSGTLDSGISSSSLMGAWPFSGTLFNLLCLLYGCLVVICGVCHHLSAGEQYPALLGTAWLAVECWSFFLLVAVCRLRLCGWLGKLAGASSARTAQPLQRRSEKTTREGVGSWFEYVSCEMQGWRGAMEDAVLCQTKLEAVPQELALFAVFDGHGGAEVSAQAKERLIGHLGPRLAKDEAQGSALRQALLDLEDELRRLGSPSGGAQVAKAGGREGGGRFDFVGCTAAAALLTRTSVTVVNVGDSRVFKCRKGECVPLTRDHKPESPRERKRIEAAGGTVMKFGPCYRVDFSLNLSRTLGDFNYKDPNMAPEDQKISPAGDITVAEIDEHDEFLCIACDGLFELMTWKSVCAYIHERIDRQPLAEIAQGLLEECCSPNVLATCGRGTDNESVIIVKLHAK